MHPANGVIVEAFGIAEAVASVETMHCTSFECRAGDQAGGGTVDTRYGLLQIPTGGRDIIGRFLARYGEWAWFETEFVSGLLSEAPRVLDGGAFVGTFGLGIAARLPKAFVCYVEANPALRPALTHNVRPGAQAVVVSALIGAAGSVPRAGRFEAGNLGSTTYAEDREASAVMHEEIGESVAAALRTVTLSALREEHGPFDLVKLDLEGMELEALLGDTDALSAGATTLWLECNEDRRTLRVARQLLDWDLPLFYFAFPSFNPDNLNGDPLPVYPMAYEAGLLAAPRRAPVLSSVLKDRGCILKQVRTVHELKVALWSTPRWGLPEWEGASAPEIAALAGRALRKQEFDRFLDATEPLEVGPEPGTAEAAALRGLLEDERTTRETVEARLSTATQLALTRLDEITVAETRLNMTERELEIARSLALTRLQTLWELETQRADLEAGLRNAESLALERLEQITLADARLSATARELQVARGLALERLSVLSDQALLIEAQRRTVALRSAELEAERERAVIAEAELSKVAARGLVHLTALGQARERVSVLSVQAGRVPEVSAARDAAWARAENLAVLLETALVQVRDGSDRERVAQEQVDAVLGRAEAAEAVIEIYRTSSIWRMSAPVRAVIGQLPYVRALARRALGRTRTGQLGPKA